MEALTGSDKRRTRRVLERLEELDLRRESVASLRTRVDWVLEIFDEIGVARGGGFWNRLEAFCDRADAYFSGESHEDDEIGLNRGKRDYYGVFHHNRRLQVMPVYDHIFLSRVYGGRLKMSWRFNRAGRLDLIDSIVIVREGPKNNPEHLVLVEGFQSCDPEWSERPAEYIMPPDEIRYVHGSFDRLDLQDLYQSLIRFGHSMCREFLADLDTGGVKNFDQYRSNQKPLTHVAKDEPAMYMLRRVAEGFPTVREVNGSWLKVAYDLNPRGG
jgi:hypothetical protein